MYGKINNHQQSVSPRFGQNFDEINWQRDDDSVKDTPLHKRTSTRRVYRYGTAHTPDPSKFMEIPPCS